jgi:hypothetical protein
VGLNEIGLDSGGFVTLVFNARFVTSYHCSVAFLECHDMCRSGAISKHFFFNLWREYDFASAKLEISMQLFSIMSHNQVSTRAREAYERENGREKVISFESFVSEIMLACSSGTLVNIDMVYRSEMKRIGGEEEREKCFALLDRGTK